MKRSLKLCLLLSAVAGLLPMALYFVLYHGPLSQNHSKWGEFGSFAGGVLGPSVSALAFVGLIYSIGLTKSQFVRQTEENGFFNLLNLHLNKVSQMAARPGSDITGVDAFGYYVAKFNDLYDEQCFNYARTAMAHRTSTLPNLGFQFLYEKITGKKCLWAGEDETKIVVDRFAQSSDSWELLKVYVSVACSAEEREKINTIGRLVFEYWPPEERIKELSILYEDFYHSYGQVLGHYFRNMFYVLQYIDSTTRPEFFSKVFRAQLSRYELAALFYNAVSKQTSGRFNALIFKYEILDDLYGMDLCHQPHDEMLERDLKAIADQSKLTTD